MVYIHRPVEILLSRQLSQFKKLMRTGEGEASGTESKVKVISSWVTKSKLPFLILSSRSLNFFFLSIESYIPLVSGLRELMFLY